MVSIRVDNGYHSDGPEAHVGKVSSNEFL
jgi:hypothetical protein